MQSLTNSDVLIAAFNLNLCTAERPQQISDFFQFMLFALINFKLMYKPTRLDIHEKERNGFCCGKPWKVACNWGSWCRSREKENYSGAEEESFDLRDSWFLPFLSPMIYDSLTIFFALHYNFLDCISCILLHDSLLLTYWTLWFVIRLYSRKIWRRNEVSMFSLN